MVLAGSAVTGPICGGNSRYPYPPNPTGKAPKVAKPPVEPTVLGMEVAAPPFTETVQETARPEASFQPGQRYWT